MASGNQQFSKFTVALLLMIFVFALGNLVFNLENLRLGEEQTLEFWDEGADQASNVATDYTIAHTLRYIYFGLLAFCVLAMVVGAYSFGKSKDRKKWRKLFYQMLGAILICVLLFAFGYFYDDIESTVWGGGNDTMLPGDPVNVTVGNNTEPAANPDTMNVIMTFVIFAVAFSGWIIIFIAIAYLSKSRSTKLDYSDLEMDTRAVAETIQRTIDALAGGSDTRATVIRCYTDMCKVMSKYGVVEQEHLTPREFEKLAVANLPVPEEEIHQLVLIFEEARYSDHDLTSEDGQRALGALEGVKAKLLEAKPPEPEKEARPDGT